MSDWRPTIFPAHNAVCHCDMCRARWEVERLQGEVQNLLDVIVKRDEAIETLRKLREFDAADIARLRAEIELVSK